MARLIRMDAKRPQHAGRVDGRDDDPPSTRRSSEFRGQLELGYIGTRAGRAGQGHARARAPARGGPRDHAPPDRRRLMEAGARASRAGVGSLAPAHGRSAGCAATGVSGRPGRWLYTRARSWSPGVRALPARAADRAGGPAWPSRTAGSSPSCTPTAGRAWCARRARATRRPRRWPRGSWATCSGHEQRELQRRTGLALERGSLGTWLVGEAGALLVMPGGRRVHCFCVRATDRELPPSDRIAHLLLALREDEVGLRHRGQPRLRRSALAGAAAGCRRAMRPALGAARAAARR